MLQTSRHFAIAAAHGVGHAPAPIPLGGIVGEPCQAKQGQHAQKCAGE